MTRPTRQTPAGRAYLDLQNQARRDGRGTQQLLTLYVVERWLARLARHMANDQNTILARVVEIAQFPDDGGGVEFLSDTATARTIRDDALYAGVRITMDARIATAAVEFRLDVNFGDPINPAPRQLDLPSIRPGATPVPVLGYPIETVLAGHRRCGEHHRPRGARPWRRAGTAGSAASRVGSSVGSTSAGRRPPSTCSPLYSSSDRCA